MSVLKRIYLALLLVALILTGGCTSDKNSVSADELIISEYYKSIDKMGIQAYISAVFPDRIAEFRLKYDYLKNGEGSITVLSPESVAGVKVSVLNGKTELKFDGATLETGELSQNGISPLNALPGLFNQWVSGIATQVDESKLGQTDALLIIHSAEASGQEIEYRTWFNKKNYNPVYAEIYADGNRIIRCEYETVSTN